MPRTQTLVQAVELALTGRDLELAAVIPTLSSLPAGGWGETEQAYRRIADLIPARRNRSYTIHHLVDALFFVQQHPGACGIYRPRPANAARNKARSLEASQA